MCLARHLAGCSRTLETVAIIRQAWSSLLADCSVYGGCATRLLIRPGLDSVRGPYMSPVGQLITRHGVEHHQYADDTQLFLAMRASTIRAGLMTLDTDTADTLLKLTQLECGPMPNVMAALPNIGGALCSTPQSLADAHY